MRDERAKLFIISGPSGSGKTTLTRKFLSRHPFKNKLNRTISFTTRPKRPGERGGRDYFFVTKEKFKTLKKKGAFLESQRVFGHFYATPRRPLLDLLKKGKDVILCIDIKGAVEVKKIYPEAVCIFILPSRRHLFETLRERLKNRTEETDKELSLRLATAKREISYINRYDYVVVNDDLNLALKRLEAIVIAENCKRKNVLSSIGKALRKIR